jgi:predicted acyl esterase
MFSRVLTLFAVVSLCAGSAFAVITPTAVDSVVTRDGKKLVVDVYIPDGGSGNAYPVILIQTPYNRQMYRIGGLPFYGSNVSGSPYAFVIADWRGFYGSISAWSGNYDRGKDGYDLVEWIATQSWSNGKIGTWGPSALGKIQFQTAKKRPPHLVCCVPLVASPKFEYQEYYPGGVYRTEYIEQLDNLGFGISPVVSAYPTYDNAWQYFIEPTGNYADSINVPFFMIDGWYDHGTVQNLEEYSDLRNSSAVAIRDKHCLMIGPWCHGGFGPAQVGSAQQGELYYYEALGYSDSLALLFFDYYLRGTDSTWVQSVPHIQYFQMGSNQWMSSEVWPVGDVSPYKLYLQNDGRLTPEMPANAGDMSTLLYNPHDPSPTIGGATLRNDLLQGPYNQVPLVESRSDVLTFSSVVLGQDVVMRGKALIHLFVSCDRKDTDYAIRLTDVYPDGRSMLLVDGIRRLRFRDGYKPSDTASAVPGTVYEVVITLPDLANTFLTGHQIRIDVTSSNYPRYDCNLNNGLAMYTAGDTLIATINIYTEPAHASYVELPLVDFTGGIDEHAMTSVLKCNPNPASGFITVQLPATAVANTVLQIAAVDGRMIAQMQVSKTDSVLKIDTRDWPAGMYILSYGNLKTKMIIIK